MAEGGGQKPVNDNKTDEELKPPLSTPCGDFTGRYIVITGGTQGLGLAIAKYLLHGNAAGVVLVSRSVAKGEMVVKELKLSYPNSNIVYLSADISKSNEASEIISNAIELFKKNTTTTASEDTVITGVVNCAAITDRGNLFTTTSELFDQQMAVNVRAPFLITQAAAKHMRECSSTGSIVNICSCAAYGGAPFVMAYSASKAALVNLTKNNATELAPYGIRVNGINLGWCYTDNENTLQTKQTDTEWINRADASVPLGRILRPEDGAATVGFLLSNSSNMMTGSIIELHPEFPYGMLSTAATDER